MHLNRGNGCLLLVCSKGKKSLTNISKFLDKIGAKDQPGIIFDDEGDQASLDTNTAKRTRSAVSVGPSAINDAIQNKLRKSMPRHVYVSVTGTPQAVLLQSADSANRPSFIRMLPAGAGYVGGDLFFKKEEPKDNPNLIALIDPNEKQQLMNRSAPIPPGLRKSLLFYLASACAALKRLGPRERGYSYLCHPSLRNDEQARAETRINDFLNDVSKALYGDAAFASILTELEAQYQKLKKTLGAGTPSFDEIKQVMTQQLPIRKLLVINARVKRQGIQYGNGLNLLIGGNTLGRGIAIRDLLVTYYIRDSRISQIDTMHQHARMYGYRSETIKYTRLFIPQRLYYRFRDIHDSDEELRAFIEAHKDLPATFPVEYTFGLRTTRRGVLDVKKVDTLTPGKHIYPNYVVVPQEDSKYAKVLAGVRDALGFTTEGEDTMRARAPTNVEISPEVAIALVKPIKTGSKNTWRDSTIAEVVKKVAGKCGNRILLRFRTADRTIGAEGFIPTGTLSGTELAAARGLAIPTLWIMSAKPRQGSAVGDDKRFMYPTLVIPGRFPKLVMFNRGS